MTIANTVASKLFVGVVAIAMALSLVAPAQAATEAELQAQIDQLMATINALQAQLGGTTSGGSSASVCPYAWTRSLSTGSTGADVMALQKFLNADASTAIAASGVGSAGMETDYYGGLTAAAVSNFQVMYRDEILTPNGLVNPTGYFGPSSIAKANALCATASTGDDMDDDDMSGDDDDDSLSGGEADVNSFNYDDEEDEIAEGEEDVPVQTIEFDVEDGDVRLERMDIRLEFNGGGTAENDPWDAFDEISIWIDGDKVASEDVTDEDDWDDISSTVNEFRLTNIDAIFREDTTGEVTIALSAANGVDIDGGSGNDDWDIFIPSEGMRFVDSLGLDVEEPSSAGDQARFELIEEGDNDDLDLESSDDDPDETTFSLDEDDDTEYMIFAFDLSAEDSDNDISLDNLYVDVNVGGDTVGFDTPGELVDDFRIEIDGESFDAESWTGTSSSSPAVVQFDIDGDATIDADEVVTVMLYANFKDVTSTFGSATITASIQATTADIDAEGADDINSIGGSTQTSEEHTLRLDGVEFDEGDSDSESVKDTNGDSAGGEQGQFVIKFDVTAFGDDIYVPKGATISTSSVTTNKGVAYAIEDADGAQIALNAAGTGSTTAVVTSSADETGSYFKINEGETESFTLTITFTPLADGFFRAQMHGLNFNVGATGNADVLQQAIPDEDYETDYVDLDA